jgi:hypothetical protein
VPTRTQPASHDAARRALDVIVIGAGQAGLATGFYLRRSGLSYVLLDDEDGPGGAWRHTWDSLRLFSPAQWSSLPGRLMPGGDGEYPTRDDVLAYLADYEVRYALPVGRPVRVRAVRRRGPDLIVETSRGEWSARAVVTAGRRASAVATWSSWAAGTRARRSRRSCRRRRATWATFGPRCSCPTTWTAATCSSRRPRRVASAVGGASSERRALGGDPGPAVRRGRWYGRSTR